MANTISGDREPPLLGTLYDFVTGDEDARVCKDIPEENCHHQPRNYFAYLGANVFSKIADELCSARLIFPWLLGALGAPAAFAGFLVPIREAGVLLPQLLVAAWIRRLALRKWMWVLGAALSAAAMLVLAASLGTLRGTQAGVVVLGLLVFYSLARGICSVSAKDVLGKTVSKTRRGSLMGLAASLSGAVTLVIGLSLGMVKLGSGLGLFALLLGGAGAGYLIALACFALIREAPGATEGGANAIATAFKSLGLVVTDSAFRHFVIARALLLSIALSPPFYVLYAQGHSIDVAGLGVMIVASGLASLVSAPLWGRFSDRSSRAVMAVSALLSGLMGVGFFALVASGLHRFDSLWETGLLFFLIAVFHGGARIGRKVYLVDMANTDNRATLVAVSNTLIGVFMLAAGAIGVLGDLFSVAAVIGVLGVVSLVAAGYSLGLREVSGV